MRRQHVADLVFVVAEQNRGWILDGICRDTAAHLDVSIAYGSNPKRLPRAKAYFFSHYSLYVQALQAASIPRESVTLVYYTHPRDIGVSQQDLVRALTRCDQVLSMASVHSRQLEAWGVPAARITTVLGAADPEIFAPHERGSGTAGFVSAYYPRKSPSLIIGICNALPHRRFVLLGRGWEHPDIAAQLASTPNLSVVEVPYSDYPQWYSRMDVFVSPSKLEGGPIPLIEAMMSNVVPVATRTGFAPDVIEHGVNGYLCDVECGADEMAQLVEAAFETTADVRQTAVHLSWQRYASLVQAFLPPQ